MKAERNNLKIVLTFEGLDSIVFDAEQATVNKEDAMMHGFEQKIRDNAAISRKQKDGTVIDVTEAMRRDAVQEMVTHLTTSTAWNMVKAQRAAPQNPTILAIANKRGCTYAEAEAWIAEKMLAELGE